MNLKWKSVQKKQEDWSRRYNSENWWRRWRNSFWTSWRSTKSTDIWRSGGGFGRRICKVGKGAQVENLLFYWFFCASVDAGRFLYLNKYASGLGSTNLSEGFFGLIFPTKRTFEPTVLLLKKAARCQPFLAVVRCLFHNHLRLKRSAKRLPKL